MLGIGFSTTDGLVSRLIRQVAREPGLDPRDTPSHTWILHDAYGGECVMGAEWSGFGVVSYDWFKRKNRIIDVIPIHDSLGKLGIQAVDRVNLAAQFLGDGYDYLELVAHLFKNLRRFKNPKKMICQEAVLRFFGELFPKELDLWHATPPKMLMALRS